MERRPIKCIKDDLSERLSFHRAFMPYLVLECVGLYLFFKFATACGI